MEKYVLPVGRLGGEQMKKLLGFVLIDYCNVLAKTRSKFKKISN
ncbi:MAG: hypothetical protein P8X85_11230 [Desulfobacterales bacterium]